MAVRGPTTLQGAGGAGRPPTSDGEPRDDPADPATLERALRTGGHRVTSARRAVHAVLAAADDHLSPDDVVARADGAVNVATVYRVLSLLEDLGLARSTRLGGGDAGASWELNHPDDHVHLVCDRCGGVDHHVGDAVSRLRRHLLSGHGFAAAGIDLVVRGTCASCRGVDEPAGIDHAPSPEAIDPGAPAGGRR